MGPPSACRVAVSTPGLAVAAGASYADLGAALEAASSWDVGFIELVMLPEWAADRPPLTPYQADWAACPRLSPVDVVRVARGTGVGVTAIHASRDLGAMLGSPLLERRARRVFRESLAVAEGLGVELLVLHAWDPWAPLIDVDRLAEAVGDCCREAAASRVRVALENIPVSARGQDQVSLLSALSGSLPGNGGLTLDLNWASLGDCFPDLCRQLAAILNVHVQGLPPDRPGRAVRPRDGALDYAAAVGQLLDRGWRGPLALELAGIRRAEDMTGAIKWLRALAGA